MRKVLCRSAMEASFGRSNMNHDDLQVWLDAYVDAWRSYDPAAVGALFARGRHLRLSSL